MDQFKKDILIEHFSCEFMSEMWLRINNKYFLLIKSHFFGVKASISFLSFKKRDHIKVHFHKKKAMYM